MWWLRLMTIHSVMKEVGPARIIIMHYDSNFEFNSCIEINTKNAATLKTCIIIDSTINF